MKLPTFALLITAILHILAGAAASNRCNLMNFVVNGAYKCAIDFANSTKLSQTVSFSPNISTIVSNTLKEYKIDWSQANKDISEVFPNLDIPKIIEIGLAIEPYIAYSIADIIHGYGLTSTDLAKLNLPALLAKKDNLVSLYRSYFELSCSQGLVRPLITCLNDWMRYYCDEETDKTAVISNILTTMENYYCDSNVWKTSVKTKLDGDLGTVYAGVAKYFGVYKHENNPYLFNILPNSLFMNRTVLERVGNLWIRKCYFIIENLVMEMSSLFNQNSTVGAGEVVERALNMQWKLTSCTLRVWHEFDGSFMGTYAKSLDHLQFLSNRYSLGELTWNKANLGDERATVVVYGDPHMITYKSPKPVTCSAVGESIYLANSFFELKGTAAPACPSCDASYVTQVKIKFQNSTSYTFAAEFSTTVANPSEQITSESFGVSVRITDMNSGAVFLLAIYRNTYMITVRMAKDLFENSMGLLINGCPEAISITSRIGTRKKRATCSEACSTAPAEFEETCVFDCTMTGDTQVVKISQQVQSLQLKVTEDDAKIMDALKIDIGPSVNNRGGIFSSSMALLFPLMLLQH